MITCVENAIIYKFRKQAMRNYHNLYQRKGESLLQFVVRVRKACYTVHFEDSSPVNDEWRKLVDDGVLNTSDHTTLREALRTHDNMDECIQFLEGLGTLGVADNEKWASLVADSSPYCASQLAAECEGVTSQDLTASTSTSKGATLATSVD